MGSGQNQAGPPGAARRHNGACGVSGLRRIGTDDGLGNDGGWRMDGGIVTKRPPVTSLMVAEHAGVSQSAVSRTFTPGASISSKTRAKVLASAKELGYRPNAIARSLITSRSRII